MSEAFVIGYDPGGIGMHGVVVLPVERHKGRWIPRDLKVTAADTLQHVVAWVNDTCGGGRIVAAGVDTLTEWNSGRGGWRPADKWLRRTYPAVRQSVKAPAGLRGSMVMSGAAFLKLFEERFRSDATRVTEAHPKVCYFALTGEKASWSGDREKMASWLLRELTVGNRDDICVADDHRFDAATAALAALRGLNGDWTLDLHALEDVDHSGRVRFCGPTHYWWPDPPPPP
ncbi:MAG TPA: DUF429 domain-containing protein [Longimicrobium sp.]|nr:DUF429 domain-containing protein [Longimicrobium sp.]